MKPIFNKQNKGIEEMQKYFSHISGLISFLAMTADVIAAQEEVMKYTGAAVMEEALAHYFSADFEKEDTDGLNESQIAALKVKDELVHHIQLAVALMAYRDYASNNDATHTKTGRVAQLDRDSEEVNINLISRDDMALMRKAYRAMDRLILFLDREKLASWINSDQYKQTMDVLLWNADLFDSFFPIDRSRYLFLMILPMIRDIQLRSLVSVLGVAQFDALLTKVRENTTLADPADRQLFGLCGSALSKLSMALAYKQLPIQLFPENISRQFWNAGNGAAAITLRKSLMADLEDEGRKALDALESLLMQREASDAGEAITDESLVDIGDRMDETNLYARV